MQCLKTADSELIHMEIISATSALDADLAAKFHYKKNKQTNFLTQTKTQPTILLNIPSYVLCGHTNMLNDL